MKKTILYLLAVLTLASVPVTNLFARASHGDWYFREEVGGTHYSAYLYLPAVRAEISGLILMSRM